MHLVLIQEGAGGRKSNPFAVANSNTPPIFACRPLQGGEPQTAKDETAPAGRNSELPGIQPAVPQGAGGICLYLTAAMLLKKYHWRAIFSFFASSFAPSFLSRQVCFVYAQGRAIKVQ